MVCLSHFRKIAAKCLALQMRALLPLRHFYLDSLIFFTHTHTHTTAERKKPKQLPSPKIWCQRRKGKRPGRRERSRRGSPGQQLAAELSYSAGLQIHARKLPPELSTG